MRDKEKIMDILLEFYEEYQGNIPNRPMIPSIYANKIIDSLQEEPVSDDLEEACKQLAENARKHKTETLSPFFSQTDYKQGVIDGAKWQNEQMMKDALKGTVYTVWIEPHHPKNHRGISIKNVPDSLKDGQKVKLIIIKED